MSEIKVERQIDRNVVEADGVFAWPIWEKEVSIFSWTYDANESCYGNPPIFNHRQK